MNDTTRDYQPSSGAIYGTFGVILFVIGASLLANSNEDPTLFRTGGLLFLGSGFHLTLTGAVARGIQLARR